jgi:hypothetical protein
MIAQGEQTVNQLTNLGQQIGHAIETHAATQSAQAMLPVIQNQYANGMQKIADGDSNGIADVTKAAGLAGQNPLTQHLSNQMIAGATQANENYRNSLLTNTRLQTAGLSAAAKMASINANHPVDEQGNPIPKAMNQFQQTQLAAKQVGSYDKLWNGIPASGNNPSIPGASEYADKINKGIETGNLDPNDLKGYAEKLQQYKALQSAMGKNAISNDEFDASSDKIENHLKIAEQDIADKIAKAKAKGENPERANKSFGGLWGGENLLTQQQKIKETRSNFAIIKNPDIVKQAIQAIPQKGYAAVAKHLQSMGIDPLVINQAIQSTSQQNPQASGSAIPAASPTPSPSPEVTPSPSPSGSIPAMSGT